MIDWAHIAERAVIHYFASAGVYLPMLWLAWVGERKRWWPPLRGWWELALPAGVSWALRAPVESGEWRVESKDPQPGSSGC